MTVLSTSATARLGSLVSCPASFVADGLAHIAALWRRRSLTSARALDSTACASITWQRCLCDASAKALPCDGKIGRVGVHPELAIDGKLRESGWYQSKGRCARPPPHGREDRIHIRRRVGGGLDNMANAAACLAALWLCCSLASSSAANAAVCSAASRRHHSLASTSSANAAAWWAASMSARAASCCCYRKVWWASWTSRQWRQREDCRTRVAHLAIKQKAASSSTRHSLVACSLRRHWRLAAVGK
jgi:hypothetical protein